MDGNLTKKSMVLFAGFLGFSAFMFAESKASDIVPAVKYYQHPLDANGKPISPADFYKQYCQGREGNQTCSKILIVTQQNSTRGGLVKDW